MKQLVLGGARSGKSSYAEKIIEQWSTEKDKQKTYLATATAGDAEMAQRIQQHQQHRDQQTTNKPWQLIEEPIEISKVIDGTSANDCILIDCLTLWLSNCLHQSVWPQQREQLLDSLTDCSADVILVSNEVGTGVVPMGQLSRQFVDESGWLHQQLAKQCDAVTLVMAGLPLPLK